MIVIKDSDDSVCNTVMIVIKTVWLSERLMCGCQLSLCNESLRELSNPGASGSIFYITDDDEFIIKTVQYKEAEFLQKLLPGYYMVSGTVLLTNDTYTMYSKTLL